jgi:hypothetical protein
VVLYLVLSWLIIGKKTVLITNDGTNGKGRRYL